MPSESILVRPAEPKDVPMMLEASRSANVWAMEQGYMERFELEPITPESIASYSEAAEAHRDWSALRLMVAERDGVIAGWAWAGLWYPSYFPHTDVIQMYLATINVHRDHMKKAVGAALIEYAKTAAIKLGARVFRAECKAGKLVEFYKAQGFRPVPYTGPMEFWPETQQMLEMDLEPVSSA